MLPKFKDKNVSMNINLSEELYRQTSNKNKPLLKSLLKDNKIKFRFKPAFEECIYSESSEDHDFEEMIVESDEESLKGLN